MRIQKPTVKSLCEEVDKLKEQLKNYLNMKIKVPELETKLNALEKAKIQDGEERVLNPLKRKKCEKTKLSAKRSY